MRNDRDNEVLNDYPRLLPVGLPPNTNVPGLKSLQLQASSYVFKVDQTGSVVGPDAILLQAHLRAITGTTVFEVISGSAVLSPGSDGTSRSLSFFNMATDTVVVRVTVEDTSTFKMSPAEPNSVYTSDVTLIKVVDGVDGIDGADGADGAEGFNARGVNLVASDQTIEYNASGQNPTPSAVTLTATSVNTSGTVYYQFFVNDVQVQSSTSNTYSYSVPGSFDSLPAKIEVQIREGSATNPILARDQTTVFGLKEGSDGITVLLSNEAHSLPASSSGSVTSFSNSGTEIEVWQGVKQLAYGTSGAGTYSVSAAGSSVTVGYASTSGKKRVYGNISAMSADLGKITYTITVRGFDGVTRTITKAQSFSKSRAGVDGQDGADGADGGTGPRTATGYLYYQYSRSTAPAKPSASSFNFSSGTFGSLTSNWSTTPPTFQAGNSNKYWYCFFTVRELTYEGSQSVTVDSARQGMGFSGLVTFSGTTLTNGSSNFNYTQIDGGWIKTGTLDASNVNVINLSASNIKSGTLTSAAIAIPADGGGDAFRVDPPGTSNNTVHYRYLAGYNISCSNSGNPASAAVLARTLGLSTSEPAGYFDSFNGTASKPAASVVTGGTVLEGARAFWSHRGGFYDAGGQGYNPFTGCHEGVVSASDTAEEGDILIDTLVLLTRGVSDAICLNERSHIACDKRAIGVFHSRRTITEEVVIAAARVMEESQDWTGMMKGDITNDPALVAFRDDYRLVQFNAVGEGLINVCGQNGNIEIGDLIVTSDMPGKGMKQDDDIVRNYTVAKSREAVTFSSPDEVKQIACIYLCG